MSKSSSWPRQLFLFSSCLLFNQAIQKVRAKDCEKSSNSMSYYHRALTAHLLSQKLSLQHLITYWYSHSRDLLSQLSLSLSELPIGPGQTARKVTREVPRGVRQLALFSVHPHSTARSHKGGNVSPTPGTDTLDER